MLILALVSSTSARNSIIMREKDRNCAYVGKTKTEMITNPNAIMIYMQRCEAILIMLRTRTRLSLNCAKYEIVCLVLDPAIES